MLLINSVILGINIIQLQLNNFNLSVDDVNRLGKILMVNIINEYYVFKNSCVSQLDI